MFFVVLLTIILCSIGFCVTIIIIIIIIIIIVAVLIMKANN